MSPRFVALLTEAGHDVAHVRDHDLGAADDRTVLNFAVESNRVLISADTDFGTLLATTQATTPSFVLIRRVMGRRTPELASLLGANLPVVQQDLDEGAIVVLGDATIRVTPSVGKVGFIWT